jgi:hypothetical protein
MASVTVTVTPYPGSTEALELEELSPFTGWVAATELTEISEGLYSATVTDANHALRARWEITTGIFTSWFAPSSSSPGDGVPTAAEEARLGQAAIAKATRFLVLPEAPLGSWGELSEFGMAVVRPDYAITELLFGLHFRHLTIDWDSIVTADDVIRVGLSADPATFPADKLPDVERALEAAISWVSAELEGGVGFA